ncbi:MAG: hypothetical protein U0792_09290 [Gemmataceae bacterium]
MPATTPVCPRLRFTLASALFLLMPFAITANGQQPDPKKGS